MSWLRAKPEHLHLRRATNTTDSISPDQIFLDADAIRLETLPLGTYAASSGPSSSGPSSSPRTQKVYEVCVCPSGKLYLSPAESSSTCQAVSNICLWS